MNANYYAVIPGNVRYDKTLTPNAKLLYGEITALCNERGYCWATNSYFSELYGVSERSVSKWIQQLIEKKYIYSELIYEDGKKEVKQRHLSINEIGSEEKFTTYRRKVREGIEEKFHTPIEEKFQENNTSINNTKDTIYNIFDFWNSLKITQHRKINKKMESHINARLEEYSVDEIKESMTNYKKILESDEYFWTHKWTLQEFMRPNSIIKFVTDNDPFNNFKDTFKTKKNKNNDGWAVF